MCHLFFSLLRRRLEVMGAKKNGVRSLLRPLLPSATQAMFFSPSRAVLSAILRDEYMTSAVRNTVLFIFISSINNKRSILRFQLTTSPLTEGGLPVALLFKMAGFGSPRFNEIAMQQPKYLDALFHFS